MEIHQIRYVVAAARHLSFTRAAAECGISQPALTKAVKGIEAELGAPLFHREGRRVLLSDMGRSVLPHFEEILQQTEATRALASNFRLLKDVPVRLGVLRTIGPVRLSRFLAGFQRSHPGVEVAVAEAGEAELRRMLEAGELDLAILTVLDGVREAFNVHDLYRERYVVVFPPEHRLSQFAAVRLSDLAGEDYVDRLACEMREMVMAVCQANAVELYARFRSDREDWVQAMVLARLGFAFMPECSVTLPGLLQRPLVEPEVTRDVALVSLPGRPYTPAASALVQAARAFAWPG